MILPRTIVFGQRQERDRTQSSLIYFRRGTERVLSRAARRTRRRAVLEEGFGWAVRGLRRRRTGLGIVRLAFFAPCPRAANCPRAEPILSATEIRTCFSLSTKLLDVPFFISPP